MIKMTRRALIRTAASSAMMALRPRRARANVFLSARKPTDIRIEEVTLNYEDFPYRTPYQFGGRAVDRVTLLNVRCVVRTNNGRVAKGFGSMSLGNLWAFPSSRLSYDATLGAMKKLAGRIRGITAEYKEPGHPIDINWALEPAYLRAAAEISNELELGEPIPKLCALVTASPFDAAIHDAFGKAHRLSCYHTYGPDFMSHDIGHYLGTEFAGDYPNRYLLSKPKAWLWVNHSVGASDPIVEFDIKKRITDGLPETLPEWINHDGITHLKIKLDGNNLPRDLERVFRIFLAASETEEKRHVNSWAYTLDFNEQCPNVGYLLDFLHRVKEKAPADYGRIQYIEQPTARDLKAHRENVMHEASKLKPVVIDESLTDFESLTLAREIGYTGVALKACKGQSQSMLMAVAAQKYKMFLTVQDLTCPGAALIHSAGIAAHVPGVQVIEANAREYVPAANKPWERRFPGIFRIQDGKMDSTGLTKPGLGAVES